MTVPLLVKLPVKPPFNRTAAELSWPVIVIVPLLVTVLEEFSVTATGPATFTVAPEPMITLSGWPPLAVEVCTGVVVEPTVVSARAGPAPNSNSGAAATAESNNLRIRARLQPRSNRLSNHSPPLQQWLGPRRNLDSGFVAAMGRR